MEKEIKYTTVKEQIKLLSSKGLKFKNKKKAVECLERYGYYNIINGYKEPYLIKDDNDKKLYKPGTTFEQIYSLFILDHNLRNAIMSAMLDLEEHLRAVTADVISGSFGTNQNDYLKFSNYRDRKVKKKQFSLQGIPDTLHKNLQSGKDPIRYYRENYGIVPPWILFKGTYFSTLVNLIHLLKAEQKEMIIQKLYGCSEKLSSSQDVKILLADTLSVCLEYRNLSAHGGRVYNYVSETSKNILYKDCFRSLYKPLKNLDYRYGISQLFLLLEAFTYQKPAETIRIAIFKEINRHLSQYPNDIDFIEKAIAINIFRKDIAIISGDDKVYHFDPNCPALNAETATMEFLDNLNTSGYTPCRICCYLHNAK